MKRLFVFLSIILFFVLCSLTQDAEPAKLTWKIIIPIILGIYDVIIRLIPSVNDYSWLSWIIKFISFLNEFFNRKKRK